MKIVLTTLNAKYIHTSMALRWLYVANQDEFDISFQEFVIKENPERVVEQLLKTSCDVIGLSVYIWNVEQLAEVARLLKAQKPELILFAGGPEVMYEPEHFLNEWPLDYIVSGEGEFVTGELFRALEAGKREFTIPGVSYKGHISDEVVQADVEKLATLPSPYQLEEDVESLKHRVVYFETSRGCPYQCQYCLSSLEKGVRYLPEEFIYNNLEYLINSEAKLIKFLDRTFNLNKRHTYQVFDYLIENHRPGLSCQFEVYADILTDEIIEYLNTNLPDNYFRFEIGIQSTYEPTNLEVKRRQDFDLLAHNIRLLMDGGKVDLHLDLIAGLPFETYDRFVKSFNDVFALGAKEVQLGFLKLLRGTNLRNNAANYGYKYDPKAPYEVIFNDDISKAELDRISGAEDALDRFWNSGRFSLTMDAVFEGPYAGRYFEFFDEMAHYYKEHNLPRFGYQLEDIFRFLHNFLKERNIDLFSLLRTDYYNNYTLRPHGFWEEEIDKKRKKRLFNKIASDEEFLKESEVTVEQFVKYSTIDILDNKRLLITFFKPRESKLIPHPQAIYPKD